MGPQHAGHGATAAYSPKRTGTARTNANPKTFWGMVGDSHGLTIAASSTTVHQHVPMASLGVIARNLFGGMLKKTNGRVWTMPITTNTCRRPGRTIYPADMASKPWVEQSHSPCIPTE